MMFLNEYRRKPNYLHDLLPWVALVAPSIVLCKDGSLLTTIVYRGPDLDSSTPSELIAASAQVNNALKRFHGGWALYAEAQRVPAKPYVTQSWPNFIAQECDNERARQFTDSNNYFESFYYLTLQYLPPADTTQRIENILIENGEKKRSKDPKSYIGYIDKEACKLTDLLANVFPAARRLDDSELLSYLHSTVSTKRHNIRVPETPLYLDAILSDDHFATGLLPMLGDHYLQPITIKSFPTEAIPGMLDALNRLDMPYRLCNRFIYMNKTEAERSIKRSMKRWFSNRKSTLTVIKERFLDIQSEMDDEDSNDKAYDAKQALQITKKDYATFGYYTFCIILSDKDQEQLSRKVRAVEQVINSIGFATHEESVNSVEAWLGTIPGIAHANVRKPLMHTLHLSRLMPTSAVWSGPEQNTHLKAQPLFQAITDGNTPFRFSTHVGDVGHAMLVGPTGAGKSTFLSFAAMSFLRYKDARVIFFDVKQSSRITTKLMGGQFYALSSDPGNLRLQPLARVDEINERTWSAEWIELLLKQEGIAISPTLKREIWSTLNCLAIDLPKYRTLSAFCVLAQSNEIRQALAPYVDSGSYGNLFDGDRDTIGVSHWLSFEMGELLNSANAARPALAYLFHRVAQQLDGRPTLVICDESWMMLDTPDFAAMIRNWLKMFRSKNASLIFATQSLDDLVGSPIFPTINDNVLSRIFLPNTKAMDENTSRSYRAFGLNDRQLKILATAVPKQDYYLTSSAGNRLFQLGLGKLALTCVASNSVSDHKLMDELERSRANEISAFLQYKDQAALASSMKNVIRLEKETRL